jgi:uncharacterized protein YlxW (UPF0749 family)
MIKYRSLVIIGTAIAIAVPGCAQMGESKSKRYAVQGCAIGGMTAGALAYVLDGFDVETAAIAGALGCMAGAVVGYQVGKRTEEYTDAQNAATSEIARNEEQTQGLQKYNAQLAQNIEDYNKQISTIKGSNLSEGEKKENLEKTREIVAEQRMKAADSLTTVETDISEAKKQYSSHQAEATTQDKNKWQAEIASYEKEKEILSGHVSTLNALDASI